MLWVRLGRRGGVHWTAPPLSISLLISVIMNEQFLIVFIDNVLLRSNIEMISANVAYF